MKKGCKAAFRLADLPGLGPSLIVRPAETGSCAHVFWALKHILARSKQKDLQYSQIIFPANFLLTTFNLIKYNCTSLLYKRSEMSWPLL